MQVAHAEDHITHALIGGSTTIEFGVSSSASLMHMLSTSLYSDQRLAVAREVTCNAWDSHIRANKTDIPIVVTITDRKLIIRDFGAGIAPELIGPLYGTYGGTDKLNNGSETGGFGLGCKSPFSYTEHFEVTSWHNGIKTIYNCSKSSADKFGKPGITRIAGFPTTESGIQVSIPVKTPNDQHIFSTLFKRIARMGEIKVELDGTLVEVLPLSKASKNWLIVSDRLSENNHQIFIRYGNVVYPVPIHTAYAVKYTDIISFLNKLNHVCTGERYSIIFRAEADSISVTPSRESLQMVEHTIDSLKTILTSFFNNQDVQLEIANEAETILEEQIRKVSEERQIYKLLNNNRIMPEHSMGYEQALVVLSPLSDVSDLTRQYIIYHYPYGDKFYHKDMGMRIDAAIALGVGKRGHLQKVKREICSNNSKRLGQKRDQDGRWFPQLKAHTWFKKSILRPLYRDIQNDAYLDLKRLWICQNKRNYHQDSNFIEPENYYKAEFGDYLPILRNVVILTYSKKDIHQQLINNPILKEMGSIIDCWVYHATMAKIRIQAARDFFISHGFVLIDLTTQEVMDAKRPVKVPPDPNKPKKVRPAGYPQLKGASANSTTNLKNCFVEGAPRIIKPTFFQWVSVIKSEYHAFTLGRFDNKESLIIKRLFGDICAIVRTEPQREKLKKEGLMELNEYVISYVTTQITTSPTFLAYWGEDLNRAFGNKDGKTTRNVRESEQLLLALFDNDVIRNIMGLKEHLNEHDLMVLSLWRTMCDFRSYEKFNLNGAPTIEEAKKTVEALAINKNIQDIVAKVSGNEFIELFDLKQFNKIARQPNVKANGLYDRMAKLVKIALLG